MVSPSRGLLFNKQPVAPASSGPVWHQVQQQTTTVCVTGSRPPGLGIGCTRFVLGRSGPICLPTGSHIWQSGGKVVGPVAIVPAQSAKSGDSTMQPDPAQESVKPEPTCLAPRAIVIKEQDFSQVVAAQIDQPDRSMRQSGPFLQSNQ